MYYDYNLINNYILYFHKNPHKLARVLLHADITTPTDKMMEELNWLKLDDRWKRQLLVVTFKCLKEIVFMSLLLIQLITDLPGIKAVIPYLYHRGILRPINVLFSIEPLLTGTKCLLVSDQTFPI